MPLALLLLLVQASTPGNLAGHALVYGPRERSVLLIGGDAAGPRPIYRLAGSTWEAVPGSELPARSLPAVAVDGEGNILMHGGSVGSGDQPGALEFKVTGETWRWDGSAWSLVAKRGPAPRDHHGMVFDSRAKTFVLFGGSDADPSGRTVLYRDTWEWRDGRWELVSESGPSARAHLAMVFDPVRNRTVMLGGAQDARTWTWDGTEWRSVAQGPPANRTSPRAVWDPVGQRVLLFGGSVGHNQPRDTWAWDGQRWKVVVPDGPPGRNVHGLAYDEARGGAIVFGGATFTSVMGDLWFLSKDKWTELE